MPEIDTASIYPRPKTYEDRLLDRKKIDEAKRKRNKRYWIAAFVSLVLTCSVLAIIWFSMNWIAARVNPVATALIIFPVGLVGMACIIWTVDSFRRAVSKRSNI